MKKRINYKSHEEISKLEYDYVAAVSATNPEEISIEDINEFLNDIDEWEGQFGMIDRDFDDDK